MDTGIQYNEMKAIPTHNEPAIKSAVSAGFKFRVEVGNAGDLSHSIAWFCRTIEDARSAFRAKRADGNMALVVEHLSGDDLSDSNQLFHDFI